MEPQVAAPALRYNNISPKLKEHIKEFEARKDIKDDEPLIFEIIGNGDTSLTAYKSTFDVDAMMDAHRSRPTPMVNLLNGESIIDPGTDDYIHLAYFRGGFAPGKRKETVWFKGKDGHAVLQVRKSGNLALYLHLILSNYCEDNANPRQVEPDGGYLYRLLRPLQEVETSWTERMAKAETMGLINNATMETLLFLAPKVGVAHHPGIAPGKLRENFAKYAERDNNHEKLTLLFEAEETQVFDDVTAAIEAGIVAVDADKAMWVIPGANNAQITPASPTHSTTQQLIDFLLVQDGQTTLKQITAMLNEAPPAAGAPTRPPKPKRQR